MHLYCVSLIEKPISIQFTTWSLFKQVYIKNIALKIFEMKTITSDDFENKEI